MSNKQTTITLQDTALDEVDTNTEENIFGFAEEELVVTTTSPTVTACDIKCEKLFLPGCCSNWRTYSNACLLELDSCRREVEITMDYEGHFTIESLCPDTCPRVYAPMCGSDKITYSNTGDLRQRECDGMVAILVQYQGPCKTDCHEAVLLYTSQCVVVMGLDREVNLNYGGSCTLCHPTTEWMCGAPPVSTPPHSVMESRSVLMEQRKAAAPSFASMEKRSVGQNI